MNRAGIDDPVFAEDGFAAVRVLDGVFLDEIYVAVCDDLLFAHHVAPVPETPGGVRTN